jgi:hypothetical protein
MGAKRIPQASLYKLRYISFVYKSPVICALHSTTIEISLTFLRHRHQDGVSYLDSNLPSLHVLYLFEGYRREQDQKYVPYGMGGTCGARAIVGIALFP